jgi:hypothetical protein
MQTAVLFVVFNRPAQTERVFAQIAKAKPPKLLVVADGPRADRPGEVERCLAVRRIVERVDWNCEVMRNYSEVNLGNGRRLFTGLLWGFEQADELIMLEDDTLPHPSFFRFCEELLEKYREDERVMHISGNRLQHRCGRIFEHSYYFSRYSHIWGYATWRRAFRHYDFEIKSWPTLRDTPWLASILDDEVSALWWRDYFDFVWQADRSGYGSYDAQWIYAIWLQHGLSITPVVNLVTNIGWGEDATHTRSTDSQMSDLPLAEMQFPLRHPPYMLPDREADLAAFEIACMPRPSRRRTCDWLRQSLPGSVRRSVRHLISSLDRVRLP